MSFSMEMYQLLIKLTKDTEGKDITLAELQNIAWWRCVWGSWRAMAYYKMDGYYECLEDVPEGLQNYTIIDDKVKTSHFIFNGRKVIQKMTKENCKSIYG